MDIDQYDNFVLVPALKLVNLYSPSAHVLLLGTAVKESELKYIKQEGSGIAMGFPQMEEATHIDCQRFLNRYDNKVLKNSVLAACFYECFPSSDALIHNLRYSIIMARIKYHMIIEPLPTWNDAAGMAQYYVKYYNAGGKANINDSQRCFETIIANRPQG
jgi:hypothetical protein